MSLLNGSPAAVALMDLPDAGRAPDAGVSQRVPIGRLAVERGFLDQLQLADVYTEQRRTGKEIGEILVARGLLSEGQLADLLALQLDPSFENVTPSVEAQPAPVWEMPRLRTVPASESHVAEAPTPAPVVEAPHERAPAPPASAGTNGSDAIGGLVDAIGGGLEARLQEVNALKSRLAEVPPASRRRRSSGSARTPRRRSCGSARTRRTARSSSA